MPKLIYPPVCILLGCLYLFSCKPSESEEKPNTPSKKLNKVKVIRKSLNFPIRCNGRLELESEITLSFKFGGIIENMRVEKGDKVYRGQVLATLNQEELQARYRKSEDNYARLKDDLARNEKLYEEENIGTYQNIESLRTSFRIAESDRRIAQKSLADSRLISPSSGVVLEKYQENGELASPGKPVYRLSGGGEVYIFKAALSDAQVVGVQIGDSCSIRLAAYPQDFIAGQVTRLATSPNPNTGLYEVEVAFGNPNKILKPRFIGIAMIFGSQAEPFAFIPPEALIEANKFEATVYTAKPSGELEAHKVKIAHILDNEIAISQGLEGIHEVVIP